MAQLSAAVPISVIENILQIDCDSGDNPLLELLLEAALTSLNLSQVLLLPQRDFPLQFVLQRGDILSDSAPPAVGHFVESVLVFFVFGLDGGEVADDMFGDVVVELREGGVVVVAGGLEESVHGVDAVGEGGESVPVGLGGEGGVAEFVELVGVLEQGLQFAVLVLDAGDVGLQHVEFVLVEIVLALIDRRQSRHFIIQIQFSASSPLPLLAYSRQSVHFNFKTCGTHSRVLMACFG